MDILERLKRAQERDTAEMRLIKQMTATGADPNASCAQVIGGEFRLSGEVYEALCR